MVGGENWAQGGGAGAVEEEVGKCKPNVGPGQSRKTDSRGSLEGAPFRKGRKGWDRCLEKRKKEGGKKVRKKLECNPQPWGQGRSPAASGQASLE